MAQADFTISTAQHGKMMAVFDGVRTKLGGQKDVLTRVCQQDEGKAKIKAFARTANGKWLREIAKFRRDLNQFFDDVGWGDD